VASTEVWMERASVAEWDKAPLTAWAVTVELPGLEFRLAPRMTDVSAPAAMVNGLAGVEVTPAGKLASVI
jgi:hypothetical protein